jgi:hypothetical protein
MLDCKKTKKPFQHGAKRVSQKTTLIVRML